MYLLNQYESKWLDKKTDINNYVVIWFDHTKQVAKIGTFSDKMCCRYGPATRGTLSGPAVTDLWQSRSGSVTPDELKQMINVYVGASQLPPFDLNILKDLTW